MRQNTTDDIRESAYRHHPKITKMGANISVLVAVAAIGLYLAYRAILPKPLEGIPYNKDAANKLFGDVPEMMGYVMRTKRIFVSPPPPSAQ